MKLSLVWQRAEWQSYLLACGGGICIGLLCLVSPWLALAATAAVICGMMALLRPIVLCYLIITITALLSGIERGRLLPYLRPNEIVLALSAGVVLVVILLDKRRQVGGLGYSGLAFMVLIGGTVFIPIAFFLLQGTHLSMNNILKLAAPLQYFLLFGLFAALPENERQQRGLVVWLLLCSAVVAIVGLMQAARIGFVTRILKNWYASSHGEVAESVGRITSLLGAWNALGIFLTVTLLIAWAILPVIRNSNIKLIIEGIMALLVICLIASGSFAGILCLVTGILFIEIVGQQGLRIVPMLLVGFVALALATFLLQPLIVPLIQQRLAFQYRHGGIIPQTLVFRFEVWRDVFWRPIRQSFPWAVRPNVPDTYAWQYEESQYVMLLFRMGLVGLLSHLAWVGISLVWLYQKYRQSDDFSRAIVISASAILVVLSIAGLTNAVFTYSGAADYLWILLGLIANPNNGIKSFKNS